MKDDNHSGDGGTKWIRWIARLWSLPMIVYALVMLIGYAWNWLTTGVADPYAVDDYPPIENLPPLFDFLSILGLGMAWRWEGLGAAIALVFQLAALLALLLHRPIGSDFPRSAIPYFISAVIVIPAILFLAAWFRARRESPI